MLGNTVRKVTWMARATTTIVGLAIMLALVFGVATTALAGTGVGATFNLGQTNTVNAVSKLVGSVAGPSLQIDNNSTDAAATALDLQVEPGKAPMTVNSGVKVANLNADRIDDREASSFANGVNGKATDADRLDGKSAGEIGVNGLERIIRIGTVSNSDSPKSTTVSCPPGKVVVGTGYDTAGGKRGTGLNTQTDIVIDSVKAFSTSVTVEAFEEEPTTANWDVAAFAICATAP
jgi:hypothetical protein